MNCDYVCRTAPYKTGCFKCVYYCLIKFNYMHDCLKFYYIRYLFCMLACDWIGFGLTETQLSALSIHEKIEQYNCGLFFHHADYAGAEQLNYEMGKIVGELRYS